MVNNKLEFNNLNFSNDNTITPSTSVTNDFTASNNNLTFEGSVSADNFSSSSSEYNTLSSLNNQLAGNNGSLTLEDNSLPEENTSSEENTNVNCLALTVKKDYSLSIVKHVFIRTWRTTWRVALSVFILNFLTFFF